MTAHADIDLGHMPSGMPSDIAERGDHAAAMEIIAADISRSCPSSASNNGECSLARQLREVDAPIAFQMLDEHIPDDASYTAEEVLSLYCTIAATTHDATPLEESELWRAMEATNDAKGVVEYMRATKRVSAISRELESKSRAFYSEWWAASVS